MSHEVRVIYRKYDESAHWHLTMRWLGEDEHGRWVGWPPGGSMRKADGPRVPIPHAHVGLFPHQGWWTAWFNARPARLATYCDVSTPPRWQGPDEVTMVDLDLDVCRIRRTGEVRVLDEDEFDLHRARYAYPPEVVEQARNAASWLYDALTNGREPFASRYRPWLGAVSRSRSSVRDAASVVAERLRPRWARRR